MYRNSLIYLVSSSSTILINFISLPIFTKFLDLSDYGTIAMFILFGTTLTSFLSLGLSQSLFRFYFKYSQYEIRVLYTSIKFLLIIIFTLFFLTIIFPFVDLINLNIFNTSVSNDLIFLSFFNGVVLYFFNYNKQLLIAEEKAVNVSILIIFQALLNFIFSLLFLLHFKMNFLALIYGAVFSNILVYIISLFINKKYFIFQISFSQIKKAIAYSYPETPGLIIQLLYSSFDKVMITNTKGLKETGLYDFGFRFATILKIIMDSFVNTWGPLFMKTMQENKKEEIDLMTEKLHQMIIIFGFFAIGISYFSEDILMILTNEKFYVVKYIIPLLIIYYLSSIFSFMSIQQIYFSGKLIYNLPVSVVGLSINLIVNIILIPLYGALGAVIATMVATFTQIIMNIYIGNMLCRIEYNLSKLVRTFLCIVFLIILIYPIMHYIDNFNIKFLIKSLIILSFLFYIIYFRLIVLSQIYNEIVLK